MPDRQLIGRRRFLVTSTCALATAAIAPKLFADGPPSTPRRLAVGFASLEKGAAVTAASGIPSGDGGFIGRGARVVVSGASGASANPRERRAVELLTHYSYFDGSERTTAPFRAWSSSRVTGAQGNSIGFHVPVDEVQKISFTLAAERGAPAGARTADVVVQGETETTSLPVTLSLQNEPGSLKLVRGYYVIVPLFENDSEPRWGGWTLVAVNGRMTLVDSEGRSAPFEHIVVKIDYATS